MERKRYPILDSLRGLVLISMVVYHTVWDMVHIFGENWKWYSSDGARLWQQSICWSFILLSGFCWSFGRVKWKRGVKVFLAGATISIVTLVAMPENVVLFGVLTLLGSCMLLMIPLEKLLKYVNAYAGLLVSMLLFLFTRKLHRGYLGFGQWKAVTLPEEWYANLMTTYIGFPAQSFYSTDYFPLIPWLFLFIAGYFIYRIFEENKWMKCLEGRKSMMLGTLGKHSLVIYMIHQPLVYGILFILYHI